MVDLNPEQFSEFTQESGVLHGRDKPIRIAQYLGPPSMYSVPGTPIHPSTWHSWRIPFESGHEIMIGGMFSDRTGRNVTYGNREDFGEGLHVWARHHTSRLADPLVIFPSRRDPEKKVGMIRAVTADELHDAIRRVGRLHGGSHGPL